MDEHKQMITDCLNRQKKLSEWDRNFIKRLSEQLHRHRPLSQAQEIILDRIWEQATA